MRYILKKDIKDSVHSDIDFEKELNSEQYKVVTESDGPSLVLAGAGSGKTRTLVYRVAHLINKGIAPEHIMLVTFTNKAARTMQDRVEMLLKTKTKKLWSGTFHHIGNRSLRLYARQLGYKPDFGILDEEDSIDLIKVCLKNINLKSTEEGFPRPKVIKSIISFSVNSGKSTETTLKENYPYFLIFHEVIKKIKNEYENKKRTSNVMDYDDLLTRWLWLLQNVSDAKERFSKQFRYIMVDEYQDTNALQANIIKELSGYHGNVLVVGDDAQAIYSFRGADVSNILNFPNEYPGAKVFRLETNYRSTPEILELANDSIAHNANQFEKHLRPVKASLDKPALIEVSDPYAQAGFIAQRILELRDEDIPLSDMAVLFRARYQSAEVEMELIKRNIPYVVRGGVRFFEQAHIKDALSYIKILINPLDELSWVRALTLAPGIGTGYAGKIFDEFANSAKLESILKADFCNFLPERALRGFKSFKKVIKVILDENLLTKPDELIKRIIESGYENYVYTHFENAKDRVDDLHELVNFAHTYKSVKSLLHDISLREAFKGETVNRAPLHEEHLVLSTIHQSKGLEWNTVFLIGLCEGQFPHSKSIDEPVQLEEERRLFYVAATRTKNDLYLLRPITRYDYQMGTVISRKSLFIEELDLDTYNKWDIEETSAEDEFVISL